MSGVRYFWAILGVVLYATTSFAIDYPRFTGLVVDEADVLSAPTEQKIDSILKSDTKNQIALVTLKSLRGRDIEEYTNGLFRHWGVGQKDIDNGVLIVIAPNERKARIEVGYGLEGTLTDLISAQIIRNNIIPNTKRSDYERASIEAAQAVVSALNAPPPVKKERPNPYEGDGLDFPADGGLITDEANLLSTSEKENILSILQQDPEKRVVVITLASLRGQDVGKYAESLPYRWGWSNKKMNNMVLIVLAPNEKKIGTIAADWITKMALSDQKLQEIRNRDLIPAAKAREYPKGLESAARSIVSSVKEAPLYKSPNKVQEDAEVGVRIFWFILILGVILIFIGAKFGRSKGNRSDSNDFGGGSSGGGGGFSGGGGGSSGGGGASGSW